MIQQFVMFSNSRFLPTGTMIDMFLPEMDGIQIMKSFRREFPDTPLIAISGGHPTSSSLLEVAQKLGAVNALEKPFDTDVLLKAVRDTFTQKSNVN